MLRKVAVSLMRSARAASEGAGGRRVHELLSRHSARTDPRDLCYSLGEAAFPAQEPDARLHHPARPPGPPRHAGDVRAGVRRRLRHRQPDRRADLAGRDPGDPRRDHQGLRPRPAAPRAVPALPRQHPVRRPRPLLRLRPARAAAHPVAPAGDAGADPRRRAQRHPDRRAARPLRRLPAGRRRLQGHHGRLHPRLLGADLLGRPPPDPRLRRLSRLAAGRRARPDRRRASASSGAS